jgi:hypothetical protein
MGRLVSIVEYREKRFMTGSAPDLRTIKRLIDENELVGRKIGKKYFIEVDAYYRECSPIEFELLNHV